MRLKQLAIFAGAIVFLAAFGLSVNVTLPVKAQGNVPTTATPQPTPKNNGGQAKWKVLSQSFKSHYPNGFEFEIEATSSGGRIEFASIVWRHSPKMGRRAKGVIEPNGKIRAVWEEGGVPQWVAIDYSWVLTDAAGNEYRTPVIHAEYADLTRKWERFESEDIIAFVQAGVPKEVGPAILKAMEERREFYLLNWGKLLSFKPRAIIYADFKAWAEWSPGAGTAGPDGLRAVGQTSNSWGGTVQVYIPRHGPQGLAEGVVLHEVGHMYQFNNGGSTHCWFYEGDATFFEVYQDYDYLARVQDMATSGELPSLQAGGPTCGERLGYDIGYAFWKYIELSYGPDAHREIWKLVSRGKPDEKAVEAYTGLTFVEVETDFRAWLGMENPVAPTPIPTPEFIFPPTPTYEPTSTPKGS